MPWFNYFDDWKSRTLHCRACGWSGLPEQALAGYHETFLDLMCPQCEPPFPPTVALVLYPTIEEMRAQIDRPEVREQLERIETKPFISSQ